MKIYDIIKFMDSWADESLAEDWDNVGFQLGRADNKLEKILLSLDIDSRVVDLAIEGNYDLIISHHPLIFTGLKSITDTGHKGSMLLRLIENQTAVYSAHTNLDKAQGGVSHQLERIFGLRDSETLEVTEENGLGYGRIGFIDEVRLGDYIETIKTRLDIDHLTLYGDESARVEKLALVGGSGASFIDSAHRQGADLLITGDIKYHDGQRAEELGINLIDVGHYHSEKLILEAIKRNLLGEFQGLKIDIYKNPSPIYKIL